MATPWVLTRDGCDRATAYHMSNKVIRHRDGVFVTWLDSQYRTMLARVEPSTGEVITAFALAQGHDNHCSAALAVSMDNRLHVVTGSHCTGGFVCRHSATPADEQSWSLPYSIGVGATYPSLLALPDGGLLLAQRASVYGGRWGVILHRQSPDGVWSWPLKVMHAAAEGYIFPTNCLTLGAHGTVHLVIEFYKTYPGNAEAAKSVGLTHLYSPDGGTTWFHDDERPVSVVPMGIEDALLIAHEPAGDLRPANLVILPDGRKAVCVWNARNGGLVLYVQSVPGSWLPIELTDEAVVDHPGWKVNSQGRLGVDRGGQLIIVTTIAPELEWAHPGQHVRCLWLDPSSESITRRYLVPKERADQAAWLPSVEMRPCGVPDEPLLMLYTEGNRGEGCVNAASCSVKMMQLTSGLSD